MSTLPSPESLRFSCRRIFLKNLRLTCRIGAYETERSASQSVVFNADIWVRFSASSSQRDALEDVLNYDLAVEIFREESLGVTSICRKHWSTALQNVCRIFPASSYPHFLRKNRSL